MNTANEYIKAVERYSDEITALLKMLDELRRYDEISKWVINSEHISDIRTYLLGRIEGVNRSIKNNAIAAQNSLLQSDDELPF